MTKRQKLSDIDNLKSSYFSDKLDFHEAFPGIAEFKIEVIELSDFIWNKRAREVTYNKNNLPNEHLNCSSPSCYGGGISLGNILRKMVKDKQESFKRRQKCSGYKGSPKGRKNYGSCMHCFEVAANIEYS